MIDNFYYIEDYFTVPLKESVYGRFEDRVVNNKWEIELFSKNRPRDDGNADNILAITSSALWCAETYRKNPIIITVIQRANMKTYVDEQGKPQYKHCDTARILVNPSDIDFSQINKKEFIDSARCSNAFGYISTAKGNKDLKDMLEAIYDGDFSKYVEEAEHNIQSIKDDFYNEYLLEWNEETQKIFYMVLCNDVTIYNKECKIGWHLGNYSVTEDGTTYNLDNYWHNKIKKKCITTQKNINENPKERNKNYERQNENNNRRDNLLS